MLHALTIDLEDWYHPELVRPWLSSGEQETQIEQSTWPLLDLLRERRVQATFFVVGQVAQQHPSLIEAIAVQGHELACHGMSHRPLWEMKPDDFRAELEEFSRVMSAITPGAEIIGFRAPTFSLDNRTRWALGILTEFGYLYDSSVFPMRTPLYGVNGCPLTPYRPSAEDIAKPDAHGVLLEFPMSVWSCVGLKIPVSGGVYLRILPLALVKFGLGQISSQRPFVIYVHPWEIYPNTPRLELPFLARLATYHNIGKMLSRLTAILDAFSFAPMRTALEEIEALKK
ncbi:MAG: polysaccharide deacetylase family protein [Anaerolineae bacterium]